MEEKVVQIPETENKASRVDSLYENFKKTKSNFNTSPEDEKQENLVVKESETLAETKTEEKKQDSPAVSKAKIKMLLRFGNFVLAGFHVVIFNLFSKYKVTMDDIKMDEDDLEDMEPYGEIEEVQAVLSKIPAFWFPIIHIEFIYITNWIDVTSSMKKNEQAKEKLKIQETIETVANDLKS